MDTKFEQLIIRFFGQNGNKKILTDDPRRCMALLKDWAKGEYQNEIRLFKQIVELGYHRDILETNHLEITPSLLIRRLHDDNFISEETSYSIIALLFMVLRNYRIQKPAAKPVPINAPPPTVPPANKTTKKTSGARKPITGEMIRQSYIHARLVYNDNLSLSQAVELLHDNYGMSSASAQMYISNIKCLFEGRGYGRDMKQDAIVHYLEHIFQDYGREGLIRALNALSLRIEHLERGNFQSQAAGVRRIYDDCRRNYLQN